MQAFSGSPFAGSNNKCRTCPLHAVNTINFICFDMHYRTNSNHRINLGETWCVYRGPWGRQRAVIGPFEFLKELSSFYKRHLSSQLLNARTDMPISIEHLKLSWISNFNISKIQQFPVWWYMYTFLWKITLKKCTWCWNYTHSSLLIQLFKTSMPCRQAKE